MNRPIMIGGAVGLVAAAAAWVAALDALATLDQVRAAAARDAAAIAAADAAPDAPFRLAAGDAARARRIAAARIRQAAATGGVLVEQLSAAAPVAPGIARLSVALSGPEKAVLTLGDGIERDGTGLRWRRWRIAGVSPGSVRLSGEVAVAWR